MKTIKQDWIEFWKKMARMLEAGIPILATFETIRNESVQPAIQEVCGMLLEEVKAGHTILDALVRFPQYFSPSMLKMVQVGEMTGKLPESLQSLAAGLEEGSFSLPEEGPADLAEVKPRESAVAESDLPVINQVAGILRDAYQQKASAIHLEAMTDGVKLRFRVDGVLREIQSLPKEMGVALVSRIKIMANMNVPEKRLPQDGRIHVVMARQPLDLRVSYTPIADGESIVLRLLTAQVNLRSMEQIFKPDQVETVRRWLNRTSGLIVVNGSVGSGKTTTLYALLKSLDPVRTKIMTVEHPVEYRLGGVCQQSINPGLGLTMAAALRAALRQDPDVVMCGEVRDAETVALMARAAMTGHRVLMSASADDGIQAAQWLVDIGMEPHLLASVLSGVISQRLVRQICAHCKAPVKAEPWMREFFPAKRLPKLYAGQGCAKCNGTGYCGRQAIIEVFEPTGSWLRQLKPDGATLAAVRAEAIRSGLKTLRDEGLALVAQGVTTLDEVLLATSKKSGELG